MRVKVNDFTEPFFTSFPAVADDSNHLTWCSLPVVKEYINFFKKRYQSMTFLIHHDLLVKALDQFSCQEICQHSFSALIRNKEMSYSMLSFTVRWIKYNV